MKVTRSHVTETDASARTAVQRSICVPLVMPGVWGASVAGRRTEARGARLHVGAIAITRLMIPGSMWRAGAQIQAAQLLSAFASAWRLDARSWRGGALGC